MKNPTRRLRILILFVFLFLTSLPTYAAEPPQTEQVKQTVALVDKAGALLSSQGQGAFPQFKVKDSEWWKGDTYIYIYDMNGTLLMNPIYPMFEGKNLSQLLDIHQKAFIQQLLSVAKTKGSGWFDFMLPRPGQSTPTQKLAYVKTVKLPDGTMVIVGSGFWVE